MSAHARRLQVDRHVHLLDAAQPWPAPFAFAELRPRPTGRPGADRRASTVAAPLVATTWYSTPRSWRPVAPARGPSRCRRFALQGVARRRSRRRPRASACPCTFTVTSGAAPGGTLATSVATDRIRKLLAPNTGALTTAGSTRKVAWLTLPARSVDRLRVRAFDLRAQREIRQLQRCRAGKQPASREVPVRVDLEGARAARPPS